MSLLLISYHYITYPSLLSGHVAKGLQFISQLAHFKGSWSMCFVLIKYSEKNVFFIDCFKHLSLALLPCCIKHYAPFTTTLKRKQQVVLNKYKKGHSQCKVKNLLLLGQSVEELESRDKSRWALDLNPGRRSMHVNRLCHLRGKYELFFWSENPLMASRAVSSAEDWHCGQVNVSNIHPVRPQQRYVCEVSQESRRWSPCWLYCVWFLAIQPRENGIIYSLCTSGTAGQFTSVSLAPSSMTAAFKSTGIYKYSTDNKRRSPLRCLYAAGAHVEHFSHEPGRGYVSVVSLHLTTKSYCAVYFNGCCYANCNYVSPQGSFKFHHFTLSHLQERIITTFLAASHFKALSYIEEWLTRLHFDTLKYDL